MEIGYLPEFLMLADTLNFTRAASALHISQPTLSRHIAELERQMGCELFERTTNSVKLTEAGRAFYKKAAAIVSTVGDLSDIAAPKEKKERVIRLTGGVFLPVTTSMFTYLAARAAYEQAGVRFKYSKTRNVSNEPPVPYSLDSLNEGTVDIVIDTFPRAALRGFGYLPLFDERLSMFVRSDNPLVRAHGLRLEDLFTQTLVTFAISRHCSAVYSECFLDAGYPASRIKAAFVDSTLDIAREFATLGPSEMFAVHKSQCSVFGLDRGAMDNIAELDVTDDRCKGTYYAVWRADESDPAVLSSIDMLKGILAKLDAQARPEDHSPSGLLWSSVLV